MSTYRGLVSHLARQEKGHGAASNLPRKPRRPLKEAWFFYASKTRQETGKYRLVANTGHIMYT
jgi:hypothetical protein